MVSTLREAAPLSPLIHMPEPAGHPHHQTLVISLLFNIHIKMQQMHNIVIGSRPDHIPQPRHYIAYLILMSCKELLSGRVSSRRQILVNDIAAYAVHQKCQVS